MNLSKSQIKKAGKVIRNNLRNGSDIALEDIERLQEYRVSHQESLQKVFNCLTATSKQHYKGSLTVYRLKRIDTIIRKIGRYQSMDLSTMQDIAGCRTIVGSEGQIRKIIKDLEDNDEFEILYEYDYISCPRDTGYSSYHLIIKPSCSERVVEVQLRTRANHHWATLVEITDVVFNIKLKEGEDHPQLYLFHKLLAIGKDKLKLGQKLEIIKIEREHEIISKIISIFKVNYYVAIDRWGRSLPEKNSQYVIMEIDEEISPKFTFYDNFIEAEDAYFKRFALNEPNMVLIHVNDADFEKIGLAYSNYVLTSHPSIRLYIEILQSSILEGLKDGDKINSGSFYEYYDELIDEILASFEDEISSLRAHLNREDDPFDAIHNRVKYRMILEDWIDNFKERFDMLKKSNNQFLQSYEKENSKIQSREPMRKRNNDDSFFMKIVDLFKTNN